MTHVNCVTPDGIRFYSEACPDRCVMEILFGFALYLKEGMVGVRQGITDRFGAFQWLSGTDITQIDHFAVEN